MLKLKDLRKKIDKELGIDTNETPKSQPKRVEAVVQQPLKQS